MQAIYERVVFRHMTHLNGCASGHVHTPARHWMQMLKASASLRIEACKWVRHLPPRVGPAILAIGVHPAALWPPHQRSKENYPALSAYSLPHFKMRPHQRAHYESTTSATPREAAQYAGQRRYCQQALFKQVKSAAQAGQIIVADWKTTPVKRSRNNFAGANWMTAAVIELRQLDAGHAGIAVYDERFIVVVTHCSRQLWRLAHEGAFEYRP